MTTGLNRLQDSIDVWIADIIQPSGLGYRIPVA